MPKAIAKRNFLLKVENKKSVIAHKGQAVQVTEAELKKFKSDLIELKK